MSTNLFGDTTDPRRTLELMAYYDPYVNPWWSPVART